MTPDEYKRLKHAYHIAGERAKGTKAGSKEQLAYEESKRRYHRAGKELARARQQRG